MKGLLFKTLSFFLDLKSDRTLGPKSDSQDVQFNSEIFGILFQKSLDFWTLNSEKNNTKLLSHDLSMKGLLFETLSFFLDLKSDRTLGPKSNSQYVQCNSEIFGILFQKSLDFWTLNSEKTTGIYLVLIN